MHSDIYKRVCWLMRFAVASILYFATSGASAETVTARISIETQTMQVYIDDALVQRS